MNVSNLTNFLQKGKLLGQATGHNFLDVRLVKLSDYYAKFVGATDDQILVVMEARLDWQTEKMYIYNIEATRTPDCETLKNKLSELSSTCSITCTLSYNQHPVFKFVKGPAGFFPFV